MAGQTTHLHLVKPTENEYGDVNVINENMDILDEEVSKRATHFNGAAPDENGNFIVPEIEYARQIVTEDAQQSSGEFQIRTTGGSASLSDGPAKLTSILGRRVHTGAVEEQLNMTVDAVPRTEGAEPITATIDRDTFVGYVSSSGTTVLTYTNAWSANPSLYGVNVSGVPVAGDKITIVYVKENRGTITVSDPEKFISTGWNLYNHAKRYARVKKYSNTYGFLVGGTYTSIQYSATEAGAKQTITPVSGYFNIPGDGYVWVNGGNNTNTYILMTWSDWGEGYEGSWQAYTEYVVDLAAIMENFPNGLMQVGGVADEINFSALRAVSRIERLTYNAENLAEAKASGRAWEADTSYIYLERETEVSYSITETGDYTASDHGMEIIEGGTVEVYVSMLYGQNLVDKLRTDVVTKSQDVINNLTSTATDKALSAAMGKSLSDTISGNWSALNPDSVVDITSQVTCANGYTPIGCEAMKSGNRVFLHLSCHNSTTGIPKNARITNLFTWGNNYKITKLTSLWCTANVEWNDSGYTQALVIPGFVSSGTKLTADLHNGLYCPTLTGNIKRLHVYLEGYQY